MAAKECKPCRVVGLYSLIDLQKTCANQCIKLSEETNDVILRFIIKYLGPKRTTKALGKLVEDGYLSSDFNEYEVERILEKRFCEKKNLGNCEDALSQFRQGGSENQLSKSPQAKRRRISVGSADGDSRGDEQHQIDDLFNKLKDANHEINPITLINLTGIAESIKANRTARLRPNFKKRPTAWATKKRTKVYQEHRKSLSEVLSAWERRFNSVYKDSEPITVENDVDLDAPPENFQFINDYIPMEGLTLDNKPVLGCFCESPCLASNKTCCPHNNEADFAYTKTRRIRLVPGSAVYECNSLCKCGPECQNRVVQLGSKVKLAIFKTKNGCGWGVKARRKIPKGTFVMEYLGEIITNEEAEKRGQVYDTEGFTYLFDLDFDSEDCQFTIDARNYGNISHFVNHSCDPNMSVYGVWINNLDVRLPRIALFANRDIKAGEEVTFDYKMTGDTSEERELHENTTSVKFSPHKYSPQTDNHSKMPLDETKELEMLRASPSGSTDSEVSLDILLNPDGLIVQKKSLSPQKQPARDTFKSDLSISLDSTSISSSESLLDSSPTSDTQQQQFSCKNYRIVCQCGAANCRKFLF